LGYEEDGYFFLDVEEKYEHRFRQKEPLQKQRPYWDAFV
jgi:hypothetical protein